MSIQIGAIEGVIRLRDEFSQTLNRVASQVDKAGRQLQRTGQQMTAVGMQLTRAVTLPIVAVGVGAVKAFGDFDQAMTRSTAIMGDLSDAMRKDMSDAARAVARETSFSAKQAAESFFFLASAGLDAVQSIEALPRVAAFAQAGAFDMALATDLLTDAQSALGLTIRDDVVANMENMARVSDVLVKANTLANATVEQFSTSLTREAGAALKSFNIDMEEGVAVLAAFADQGVKGEIAGTGLSRILRLLTSAANKNKAEMDALGISVFDAGGNIRNMADIIFDLETALGDLSDQQRTAALESIGLTARVQGIILPLLGASDAIREYEAELRSAAGTTQEVADKQLRTLNAQLGLLKDRIVDTAIGLGEVLAPLLERFVKSVVEPAIAKFEALVKKFAELPAALQGAIVAVAALAAAAGPALIVGGLLLQMLGSIMTMAPALAVALGKVLTVITGPVGLVAAGAALLIAWRPTRDLLFDLGQRVFSGVVAAGRALADAWRALWELTREWRAALVELAGVIAGAVREAASAWLSLVGELVARVREWLAENSELVERLRALAVVILRDVVGAATEAVLWLADFIAHQVEVAKRTAEAVARFLEWSGALDGARIAIDAVSTVVKALTTAVEALARRVSDAVGGLEKLLAIVQRLDPKLAVLIGLGRRWARQASDMAAKTTKLTLAVTKFDRATSGLDDVLVDLDASIFSVADETARFTTILDGAAVSATEAVDEMTELDKIFLRMQNQIDSTKENIRRATSALHDWIDQAYRGAEIPWEEIFPPTNFDFDILLGDQGIQGNLPTGRGGNRLRDFAGALRIIGFQVDQLGESWRNVADGIFIASEGLENFSNATATLGEKALGVAQVFQGLAIAINGVRGNRAGEGGAAGALIGAIVGTIMAAGNAAIGAAIGSAIGSAAGSFVKKGAAQGGATINLFDEGVGLRTGSRKFSSALRDQSLNLARQLEDAFGSILDVVGGTLANSLQLGIDQRKGEWIKITVGGIEKYFQDTTEALNFAVNQILSQAEITGIDEAFRQLFEGADFTSLEQMQQAVETVGGLIDVYAMSVEGLSSLEVEMQRLPDTLAALTRNLENFGLEADQVERLVGGALVASMQAWRQQITGEELSIEQREKIQRAQAMLFNAQFDLQVAELEAKRAVLIAGGQIAQGEAQITGKILDGRARFVEGTGRIFEGELGVMLGFTQVAAGVVQTGFGIVQEFAGAIGGVLGGLDEETRKIVEAIDSILAALREVGKINLDNLKLPGGGSLLEGAGKSIGDSARGITGAVDDIARGLDAMRGALGGLADWLTGLRITGAGAGPFSAAKQLGLLEKQLLAAADAARKASAAGGAGDPQAIRRFQQLSDQFLGLSRQAFGGAGAGFASRLSMVELLGRDILDEGNDIMYDLLDSSDMIAQLTEEQTQAINEGTARSDAGNAAIARQLADLREENSDQARQLRQLMDEMGRLIAQKVAAG